MQRKEESYLSSEPLPLKVERGFLLTTWLIFFIFVNGYFIYAHVQQGAWLPLIWAVFGVLCGIGTWFWFKLAFYGMLLGYGYNVMQNIDAQSISGIVFSLVFMGLTYFLVRQKWEFFK
jgi:hypothetical protein